MDDLTANPIPRILEARGTTVLFRDVKDAQTVAIDIWSNSQVGQPYHLWLQGFFYEPDNYERQLVFSGSLTSADIQKGFVQVTVPFKRYEALVGQMPFAFSFGANFDGSGVDEATRFTGYRNFMLVKNFLHLTDFDGDDMSQWVRGTDVPETDLKFATFEGKRCLHFSGKNNSSSKTVVYRDYNLFEGRRYYFSAMFCAPEPHPQTGVEIFLKVQNRYANATNFNSSTPYFITAGGGITGKASPVRLEIVANHGGGHEVCDLYFTNIIIYEYSDRMPWESEWDVEWGPDEYPDAMSAQGQSLSE